MREYGSQAVVWQTAVNPIAALELLDSGEWKGTGVLGPELPRQPFLTKLGGWARRTGSSSTRPVIARSNFRGTMSMISRPVRRLTGDAF